MATADVAVTGIGLVTPLGASARETFAAWQAGRCAERRRLPELAGTALESADAAVLPPFDPAARLGGRRMLKFMSDAAVLGCIAAHEACAEAAIRSRFRPERVGLFAATGLAAAGVEDVVPLIRESIGPDGRFSCRLLGERGLPATNPLLSFKILANMPPCIISIIESIKGPNCIFTPWEDQAAQALIEAWRAVADGDADCAVAGAADSPAHPATLIFLRQAGHLREGEFPADAAAYIIMERAETAARDGRPVHARIESLELRESDGAADPLAGEWLARIGCAFAAAPALLLALACMGLAPGSLPCPGRTGGATHEFRVSLRGAR